MEVAIIGKTGMLGSMMAKVMPEARAYNRKQLDVSSLNANKIDFWLEEKLVINCIGLIKPYCTDVEAAIKVNSLFPYMLPKDSIQIATDCVYSGADGDYIETASHDALDVYGKTKSLGEAPHIKNLRCSIIGPEQKNHLSLFDWFMSQEGEVNGYTNHFWNGLTTYHFAKLVKGIIDKGIELPNIQHLIPADDVTKYQLLRIIAHEFGKDVTIKPIEAPEPIDRTLSTSNLQLNHTIWQAAGYARPLRISEMIAELAEFMK